MKCMNIRLAKRANHLGLMGNASGVLPPHKNTTNSKKLGCWPAFLQSSKYPKKFLKKRSSASTSSGASETPRTSGSVADALLIECFYLFSSVGEWTPLKLLLFLIYPVDGFIGWRILVGSIMLGCSFQFYYRSCYYPTANHIGSSRFISSYAWAFRWGPTSITIFSSSKLARMDLQYRGFVLNIYHELISILPTGCQSVCQYYE